MHAQYKIVRYMCIIICASVNNIILSSFHKFNEISPTEPSEPPSNIIVTAMNATTVLVTWIPPLPEDRNGIIQSFTIRVVGVHTLEDFSRSINATEITIGSLHPFYSYRFSVATVTISHGPFSNPIMLMMPPLGMYI